MIKVPNLVQLMIDIEYRLIKYPLSIQDGRQKSKMAVHFFDISTSDGGDLPRIIEIALFFFYCQLLDLLNTQKCWVYHKSMIKVSHCIYLILLSILSLRKFKRGFLAQISACLSNRLFLKCG